MSSFFLTNKAKTDLKDIARYTEERWGKIQRNIYLRQFDNSFHLLADNPLAGKKCNSIRQGYRKFLQGSHIIFYTTNKNSIITIIRILHKSMDIQTRFDISET